jgi:hypothetical protein
MVSRSLASDVCSQFHFAGDQMRQGARTPNKSHRMKFLFFILLIRVIPPKRKKCVVWWWDDLDFPPVVCLHYP